MVDIEKVFRTGYLDHAEVLIVWGMAFTAGGRGADDSRV